jgi:hypothetical protein
MVRMLQLAMAAVAAVFLVSSASAAVRSHASEYILTMKSPAILVRGFRGGGGGFRGGGGGFRGFRGGGFRGGGRRSFHGHHRGGGRSYRRSGRGRRGSRGTRTGHYVSHNRIGRMTQHRFGRHVLRHQVLGRNHAGLVGHRFRRPGASFHGRLAKLHNHHWHRSFKHVVIVGGFGGLALCDLYCAFDVPDDLYGDFVAAVDEAGPGGGGIADAGRGWDKAISMLERASDEEEMEVADAKAKGEDIEIVEDADEQIDVVVNEDDAPKKG